MTQFDCFSRLYCAQTFCPFDLERASFAAHSLRQAGRLFLVDLRAHELGTADHVGLCRLFWRRQGPLLEVSQRNQPGLHSRLGQTSQMQLDPGIETHFC